MDRASYRPHPLRLQAQRRHRGAHVHCLMVIRLVVGSKGCTGWLGSMGARVQGTGSQVVIVSSESRSNYQDGKGAHASTVAPMVTSSPCESTIPASPTSSAAQKARILPGGKRDVRLQRANLAHPTLIIRVYQRVQFCDVSRRVGGCRCGDGRGHGATGCDPPRTSSSSSSSP